MRGFFRRLMEWRGRRKGAQIIVFDGAGELEKTRAFAGGAVFGIIIATVLLAITAPETLNPGLTEELARRDELLQSSNERADKAMQVADVCLSTAQNLERTLALYQSFLGTGTADSAAGPRLSDSLLR